MTIQVDDIGVRRELADGHVESVTWDDLIEVSIVTTSDGPFAEDVFFVLEGGNGTGCAVPQSAAESSVLLERLQRLPGFDNQAVIRAMTSTDDNKFVCWRRQVDQGADRSGSP
jgi:hypothetical protein